MRVHRQTRTTLDCAMLALFLFLAADRWTGNAAHEIAGVLLFLLFALHTAFNAGWYANLARGAWPAARLVRVTANLLLLAAFAGTMAAGVLASKTLFVFLGLAGGLEARTVHMGLAHWTLLLAGFHLGLYWPWLGTLMPQALREGRGARLAGLAALVMAVFGAHALWVRDMDYVLTMQSAFSIWLDEDS
ncbi:MAG: hypothetical protein Q4F72_04780, partial [Desulfovibrionaceae bacterium]|nr:hypothetical protein [Desulfovibrionaceae bacterium]